MDIKASGKMKIQDYLIEHKIIKIGMDLPGYICTEIIVENPEELIKVVEKSNCYISAMRWWEYTEISSTPTIGYGGARDPRDPEGHFFAETDLCMEFSASAHCTEYRSYLSQIKTMHPNLILFPAFDIKLI